MQTLMEFIFKGRPQMKQKQTLSLAIDTPDQDRICAQTLQDLLVA